MAKIIEVRRKIEEIKAEYVEKMKPLKEQLQTLQEEQVKALLDLEIDYTNECNDIIENFIGGTIEKIPNVSVRTLNDFEVVDKNLVPLEYYEWQLSTKAIKEKLVETNYTEDIPGIKAFKKYSVAVKL